LFTLCNVKYKVFSTRSRPSARERRGCASVKVLKTLYFPLQIY